LLIYQDLGGIERAMHDPLLMGMIEASGHLLEEGKGLVRGEVALLLEQTSQ
jgi:hypothetical protein